MPPEVSKKRVITLPPMPKVGSSAPAAACTWIGIGQHKSKATILSTESFRACRALAPVGPVIRDIELFIRVPPQYTISKHWIANHAKVHFSRSLGAKPHVRVVLTAGGLFSPKVF